MIEDIDLPPNRSDLNLVSEVVLPEIENNEKSLWIDGELDEPIAPDGPNFAVEVVFAVIPIGEAPVTPVLTNEPPLIYSI